MPPDLGQQILTWGPPGVVLMLVLGGFLITKGHADDLRAQCVKSDVEKVELRAELRANTDAMRGYAQTVAAGFEKIDGRLATLERRRDP